MKKLKYALSDNETKHAAFTDALVAQMKEHLHTAVTKCKQYAKENATLKETVKQLEENKSFSACSISTDSSLVTTNSSFMVTNNESFKHEALPNPSSVTTISTVLKSDIPISDNKMTDDVIVQSVEQTVGIEVLKIQDQQGVLLE